MRTACAAALVAALLLIGGCGEDDAGKLVEGPGYDVTVPEGWDDRTDRSDEIEFEGFSADVLLTGEREDGFLTNVNILRTMSAGYSVDRQVREERRLLETGRVPGSDAEPRPARDLGPVERLTIDGEPARAYDFRLEQEDELLELRQVIAVHGGAVYVTTLTTAPGRLDEDRVAFDAILDSWRWR